MREYGEACGAQFNKKIKDGPWRERGLGKGGPRRRMGVAGSRSDKQLSANRRSDLRKPNNKRTREEALTCGSAALVGAQRLGVSVVNLLRTREEAM